MGTRIQNYIYTKFTHTHTHRVIILNHIHETKANRAAQENSVLYLTVVPFYIFPFRSYTSFLVQMTGTHTQCWHHCFIHLAPGYYTHLFSFLLTHWPVLLLSTPCQLLLSSWSLNVSISQGSALGLRLSHSPGDYIQPWLLHKLYLWNVTCPGANPSSSPKTAPPLVLHISVMATPFIQVLRPKPQ